MTTKEILKITKTLHLLYVEDDASIRKSSIDLFENFFAQITTAIDGLEALEIYKKGNFDLIITDISMPRMDGIEFLGHVRQDHPRIPLVIYSAWNNAASMASCIALNIDAYLLKPIQTKSIMQVLEKIATKLIIAEQNQLQGRDSQHYIQKESKILSDTYDIDALTGLKSHTELLDKIIMTPQLKIPVMILINIDTFHVYNELYGLSIGDTILKEFASILKLFCENHPYELYRMSGDEFILFEYADVLDPEHYDEDIKALFCFIEDNPIHIDTINEAINLSITVGVSFDRDNSYGKADMALYEARRQGRQYLGFSAEADRRKELQHNLYWREELALALTENRVHAFYHAIVDKDENVIKYESLIRIKQVQNDGKVKLIAPKEFLNFSKISKQYIALTNVMIEESFKSMLEHNIHIAINLTFHDIENKEINKLLHKRILKYHLASKTKFDISSQVIFELLEHSNHNDYKRFMEFINEFKALGVLITIDNFGLGFANISKIAAMAPNYVKIDATLIKNIDTDIHAYSLVKAIVKFASELGIKTIAEHVSNKAIFEKCKALNIDEFQGYYFGEPIEEIPLIALKKDI